MWANKISNLAPVYQMHWLETLELSDFPLLREIRGIEGLKNLRELHLSGNQGSLHPPLRMESVLPIAGLSRLEKLETLPISDSKNRDVTFVATSFPNLKSLGLSNEFERSQFAYMAKKLNAQLRRPILASRDLHVPCAKCGGALHLFTGRQMPIICKDCNERKFQKMTEQFDQLKADAPA